MTTAKPERPLDKLLHNLLIEVFQTETSAIKHCRREADRLRSTTPAEAMLAVSQHARETMPKLIEVCRREDLPVSAAGNTTGMFLSQLRDKVIDRLVKRERSYRVTLLGIRHGIDLMHVVSGAADGSGKLELEQFCQSWLTTRVVLTERVQEELQWFVRHPERAIEHARPWLLTAPTRPLQHT